ncbi:hssA/2C/7E family protein [Cavenderia fasciculata]|uniref:HssA/2C/7E family protein n=1 Tax=Cavenderia fasciculata TaxID=261658 RepID=F4QC02_CACFS|nr:hssA/2C/7E family protein [Cavenderia fasciculata]EGG14740.1 hssA/2C/7E family protein [Cavenderia fasciculata]|eukprot:XP_004351248.1 hssA/2C/7E family protein [Cavenderia fasciculata]
MTLMHALASMNVAGTVSPINKQTLSALKGSALLGSNSSASCYDPCGGNNGGGGLVGGLLGGLLGGGGNGGGGGLLSLHAQTSGLLNANINLDI